MKRLVSTALKVTVTLILLVWVFSHVGLDKISGLLLAARVKYLVLALALFTLSNFIGALQWQRLLEGLKTRFPYSRALKLYLIGIFFNNCLPGSVGGDFVKIYSISRQEKRGREALAATFVDRFAGFFLLSLFAILGSAYFVFGPIIRGNAVRQNLLEYIIIIFVVFLAASAVLFSRRVGRLIYEVLLARINPFGLRDKFREVHDFFHSYRHQYRLGTEVFALSFLIQFSRIAVHYYCALAIGFDISFIYFLIFIPLIAMVALAPVSFGGLGVRESTAPFLFTSVAAVAAVDPSGTLAVGTQFLASLVGIVGGLIGGALFLFSGRSVKVEPGPPID